MTPGASHKASAPAAAGRGKPCELLCDTQSIIISILRFSMKNVPAGELFSYALSRIAAAPFIPFDGRGCIFTFDESRKKFSLAAGIGLTGKMKTECSEITPGRCACGAGAVSDKIHVSSCLLRRGTAKVCIAPLVYRGRTLGVMNLYLKKRDFDFSVEQAQFLTAVSNMLAGILFQKNAETELLKIRRELNASRRLADIGALSASVAHELRSPLAVIKTASSNIRKKSREPLLEKHLSNIEKKVFECDRIINNLLFYARLKKPELERTHMYDIILESIRESRLFSGAKKFSVKKDIQKSKGLYLEVDPVQIKEVFTNILLNCFESYGGKKGAVFVKFSFLKDSSPVFVFRDKGRGISRGDLSKIFNPFFTTKPRGNGLGLSVAGHMVQMHGGRIEVRSKPGEGSVFKVILPAGGGEG